MKKTLISTLKQYVPMAIATVVYLLLFGAFGILLGDSVGPGEIISEGHVFLIFSFPIYFAVHGVLSYRRTKKVWLPNAFLFLMLWLGIPLVTLDFRFYLLFLSSEWLFLPSLAAIISLIASMITWFFSLSFPAPPEENRENGEQTENRDISQVNPDEAPAPKAFRFRFRE